MKTREEHEAWVREAPDRYAVAAYRGRTGGYDKREGSTLAAARALARGLYRAPRPVMIYAVRGERQVHIENWEPTSSAKEDTAVFIVERSIASGFRVEAAETRGFADSRARLIIERAVTESGDARSKPTVAVVESIEDLSTWGGPFLVNLYNYLKKDPVTRFESLASARRRVWDALCVDDLKRVQRINVSDGQALAPSAPEPEAAKPKEPASRKERAPRASGADRFTKGATGAFKPVGDGNRRADILRLIDGTRTPDEVAAATGVNLSALASYCAFYARDCGIGTVMIDGKLALALPLGKTRDDLIRKKPNRSAA